MRRGTSRAIPVIAPAVLALGISETRSAERIFWTTKRIEPRAVVPDTVYLGPGYGQGLFLYYLKLWLTRPADMRASTPEISAGGYWMFTESVCATADGDRDSGS